MLLDKSSGCQFKDKRAVDLIEAPVEGIERFAVAKAGALDAALKKTIAPPRCSSSCTNRFRKSSGPKLSLLAPESVGTLRWVDGFAGNKPAATP